jgi:TolB-like protein/tetratricopeptide (TPR) repeat protein
MVQLGHTVFDLSKQMLRDSAGAKIALRAQAVRVLEHLIKANGALVTKDQLVSDVWANLAVTDDSLVQCIGEIRLAIGDERHEVLQTERRRGYRLVATAASHVAPTAPALSPSLSAISPQSVDGQITPAIAVMAFTSMDGDERSERLAMTFAGDLITELARHKELRVIGRFSSFSLKGHALSSKEVCEKLNARYIVSGQVQFTETTIDWSLEMMDGHNDEIVWTEHKQVSFSDIHAETAALFWRIAGTIHANFKAFTWKRSMARPPDSLNAYDLCALATASVLRTTVEGTREGQQFAAQAVSLYPQYARSWRVLTHSRMWDMTNFHTGEWTQAQLPRALKDAHKAIELDETQAIAYSLLALLLNLNGQPQEAVLASERALTLGPGDPNALHMHATVLFYAGRLEESRKISASLSAFAPMRYSYYLAGHGRTLVALGERQEGILLLQDSLTLSPGLNSARVTLIAALEEIGQHASAALHYQALLENSIGFDGRYFDRRWSAIPEIGNSYHIALQAHGMKLEAA